MIKRHRLRRGWIDDPVTESVPAQRKLLQDVVLKRRRRHGRRRHDRQRDPHPFAVEKEKQLVVHDRAAEASAEMVHGRARLVISRRRIGEKIGGVEARAVPEFVEISVKLVRAGLGDVVHLRRAVAPLIHGVGSVLTVTSEIEFRPSTRFVERPLFRLVSGSLVSRPSTM